MVGATHIVSVGLDHVLEAQQFDKSWLEQEFFPLAEAMGERLRASRGYPLDALAGKGMISFFSEPSTRTRASFEIAMWKLGGTVIFSTENAAEFSSVVKGETLPDTIRVLNRYFPDVIVLRSQNEGDAKIAAEHSKVPIINAGDGAGQHPTQALLDLYTIWQKFGRIDGLEIAMVGDLAKGRTVRSLCYLLGKFPKVKIRFVSPETTRMRKDIIDYLKKHNILFNLNRISDLRDVAATVDIIYQTERGTDFELSNKEKEAFTVNGDTLKLMKQDAIIMHPLPRNTEIALEVDSDPRAVYLTDQIDSGLFTKMALLMTILFDKD